MSRKLTLAVLAVTALALIVGGSSMAKTKSHGWLGVFTQEVEPEIARAFDLGVKYGAIINEVVEDSPAEKAGLKADDVIVAFND
ncbi:PDZ domain-containing protein, partial [candidate division GN15 bacterium]|nr:PDZ domain-containing protein [candidate division GN15 bacterium]